MMAVDPALHLPDVLDRVEIEKAAIDEGADLVEKRPAQIDVTADRTRLEHCCSLPGLAERFVVRERCGDRIDDRSVLAVRTQAQIDAKHEAVWAHLAARTRADLGHARGERRAADRPA